MKPSVGRVVHYRSFGTPGGEYTAQCRAAMVTEVGAWITVETKPAESYSTSEGRPIRNAEQWFYDDAVSLAVLNPTGEFFNVCKYDEGTEHAGTPSCVDAQTHGNPFRYCACGWREASYAGGTWHWPERVES
jgi:hypothetical protein